MSENIRAVFGEKALVNETMGNNSWVLFFYETVVTPTQQAAHRLRWASWERGESGQRLQGPEFLPECTRCCHHVHVQDPVPCWVLGLCAPMHGVLWLRGAGGCPVVTLLRSLPPCSKFMVGFRFHSQQTEPAGRWHLEKCQGVNNTVTQPYAWGIRFTNPPPGNTSS